MRDGDKATRGASVVAVALCAWCATTSTACTYSDACWETRTCAPDPEPPPGPCEGEPGTAPALDECGVFVSEHGDDDHQGTKDAPVKTLQRAVGLATTGRGGGEAPTRRVYACGEVFDEAISLPSGVDLWGGRRCDGGGWSFGGPAQRTTIAPPGGVPLRVIEGDDATSTISGVRVVAADASAIDGRSSIAVILSYGARVKLVSSVVIAGNGKDGEPGEDAPSVRAQSGQFGNDGADACTADAATGALPVVTACGEGIESTGGYGGDGGIERGGDGASGQTEPTPNPESKGLGGAGAGSTACSGGKDGVPGADRGRASGAAGIGYLTDDGWIGVRGDDGEPGGVGQAGGGGGGSKSRDGVTPPVCPASRPQTGAAGGSGGGGGCGGLGGKGGGYGGASIGIVALEGTELTIEATEVIMGRGGNGGTGGTGQPGGFGKHGGYGGKGFVPGMWDACHGGYGGNGGRGGDAGGGLGGPSIGIAYVVPNLVLRPGTVITVGAAGDGGLAGNAGTNDEAGKGGFGPSAQTQAFSGPNELPR
ncbi:hypothetical protein ACSRUE_30365 [Sorangium sp. KYC3313]|uniref:hypothetical protein n=1 Tax=Sorangium sp. KYC3313 TaxID=3449740 RepID=UPI003F8979DC